MSNTRITLDRWLIPQLQEVLQSKMSKGDIQAELDLTDSSTNSKIRVDLKQLFIIIQALIHVPGNLGLEERKISILENPLGRQLFIVRQEDDHWQVIKDLTNLGITQRDIAIRDQANVVNHNWNQE